jgi:hypothetical protein
MSWRVARPKLQSPLPRVARPSSAWAGLYLLRANLTLSLRRQYTPSDFAGYLNFHDLSKINWVMIPSVLVSIADSFMITRKRVSDRRNLWTNHLAHFGRFGT